MAVVTFTTDFGLSDAYVGAMKGVVLSLAPDAVLVDITHEVPPQDVRAGALALAAAAPCFPRGSVHVAVVDPGVGSARHGLAVAAAGSLFVGPDNGLMSLAAVPPRRVFRIENALFRREPTSATFHGRDVFAVTAGRLAAGHAVEEAGALLPAMTELPLPARVPLDGGGEGEVLHVDRFGNLITSFTADPADEIAGTWEMRCQNRRFELRAGRTFSEVDRGCLVLYAGSGGHAEVAVRGRIGRVSHFGKRRDAHPAHEVVMKAFALLLAILALPLALGCSVGKGVGAAKGAIYAYGCSKNKGDYCSGGICGTEATPAPYDLRPSFFAGEPIDDLREYSEGTEIMRNRVIIRLQTSGKQIEQNDVLTFDVVSSYEVARCVRGRVNPTTGQKDWNEDDCYRASDDGPGRVRLQFDSPIHAALTLKSTCGANSVSNALTNLVGSAISAPVPPSYATAPKKVVTDGSWSSWVELQEFGDAAQLNRVPTERDPVGGKFRVELGDRIYATSFLVTLIDDGVVEAAMSNLQRPTSLVGGYLGGDPTTGRFDFDLQRGQGAQFFP